VEKMFCFQCEQTMGGKGCTVGGVCGKAPQVANKQDELTCALVGLARAAQGKTPSRQTGELVMQGLFATLTNVNFDVDRIDQYKAMVEAEKKKLGGAEDFKKEELWTGDPDLVSLRSTLLFGLRGMAAYALHSLLLGKEDKEVTAWFYKGLNAVGQQHTVDEWLGLIMEFGQVNLKCMALHYRP
jgi:hydroxylamine reductase